MGECEDGLGDWDLNGRWVGRFMGHEVKWVGYLGCLTWRVIHFGMGLYFCLGVAERTYT